MIHHTASHEPPHLADDVVHDAADGRLPADAAAAAERHLAACAACAGRVERVRRLLVAAAALPNELPPPADGWPALRATLAERDGIVGREAPPRVARISGLPRRALLVAATLLVAVAAWSLGRGVRPDLAPPGAASEGSAPAAAFAVVERDYARAAAELSAELAATRHELPPTVAASLDRSLATVDDALAEARAALRDDPANPEIARFVTASYERKLDLLRRSTAIGSGD